RRDPQAAAGPPSDRPQTAYDWHLGGGGVASTRHARGLSVGRGGALGEEPRERRGAAAQAGQAAPLARLVEVLAERTEAVDAGHAERDQQVGVGASALQLGLADLEAAGGGVGLIGGEQ